MISILTGKAPMRLSKSRFGVGDGLPVLGSIQLVVLLAWSIKNIRPLSEYEKSQPGGNGDSLGLGLTPTSLTRVPVALPILVADATLRFVGVVSAIGEATLGSSVEPFTGPTKSSNGWVPSSFFYWNN